MSAALDEWEDILDPGERVVWQGAPDTRVVIKYGSVSTLIFGLIFAGFALVWMVMTSQAGGTSWMIGLIHFSGGLGVIFYAVYWDALKRRYTWYTLTNKRAFIATNVPFLGRRLESYPITEATAISLDTKTPGSIMFSYEMRQGRNGDYRVDIGFERVENAKDVYRRMRQVQEGQIT